MAQATLPLSPSSCFQFLMRTLAKDTTSLSEQCLRTPFTATPILVVCKARGLVAGLGIRTHWTGCPNWQDLPQLNHPLPLAQLLPSPSLDLWLR